MHRAVAVFAVLAVAATACGRPDWHLARRERDGLTLRRWQHQSLRVVGGVAAYGAFDLAGMRPGPAGAWGCLASGFLPHLVGYAQGRYAFDGGDWLTDGVTGCGSAIAASLCVQRWHCGWTVAGFAVSWALTAPRGRP